MTDDKLKHLEFIQNVITRMNTNSFQIKGWSVALVSALLAIFASTQNKYFVLAAIFPVIVLWFLDAYYLMLERKFRGLYDDIAEISEKPKELKPFAMRPDLYDGNTDKKYTYLNNFRSPTIFRLYFPISVGLVILFIYLFVSCTTKGV